MSIYVIPPLLSLLCFLSLAILVISRKQRSAINIIFFFLCVLGVILYTDISILFLTDNPQIALWSSRIDHVFVVYAIPLFIHFFHTYLKIRSRNWLIYLGYTIAFVLMWFALTPLCIQNMHLYDYGYFGNGGKLYPVVGLGAALACIYSFTILIVAIKREQNSVHKNKLKYVLMGFGVMGLLNGLNVLPLLGYAIYPPGTFSFLPLIILAVGLYRYDLLDMGLILQKGILYSCLTLLLTCFFAVAVTVSNQFLHQNIFLDSLYLQIFFFFIVVIVFGPLQSRMLGIITHYFHREASLLETSMPHIHRKLSAALDNSTIVQIVLSELVDNLHISHVSLYLKDKDNDGFRRYASKSQIQQTFPQAFLSIGDRLITLMEKSDQPLRRNMFMQKAVEKDNRQCLYDMEKLWAEIIFPMKTKKRLIGFLVLGHKKSRTLFSREEQNLLQALSIHVSLALDKVQSYQQVVRLNNNLEAKVQKRTQALQEALTRIKKAQDLLIRSESLAAIGQLVAGVAHELNNPISTAMSLIQSAQTDLDINGSLNKETLGKDLAFSLTALKRVKRIVASLLCLSRQSDSYEEWVDINDVAQDALRILDGRIMRSEIQIDKDFQWPLPSIQGNFAHLGQVAINIIRNAYQSMVGRQGRIVLSTRFQSDTNDVVLACKDRGTGVNPSLRNHIFKPFFTTKPVGQGTGLGLYISHEIVRKHQGRIVHENNEGGGALFEVFLPVR